jgi:hypothetical protein
MKKIKIKRKIPVAMPSALIQQDYGESVSKHGYLLWDIETRTPIERDIPTEYGFYKFKITSLKDIDNDNEELLNF